MSRYIVPEEMLEDYKHFIDAVINTELSNIPISITNSFTVEGRKIVFTLKAEEQDDDYLEDDGYPNARELLSDEQLKDEERRRRNDKKTKES